MTKQIIIIDDAACEAAVKTFITEQQQNILHTQELNGVYNTLERTISKLDNWLNSNRRILINTADSITYVRIKDILRCKSNRNYTELYFKDNSKLLTSKTLKEFEELLTPYHFVRIHKSHLINATYLQKFVKSEGGFVLLSDGTTLPVAVRKKELLISTMKKLQNECSTN